MAKKLTAKQKAFVDEYLIDLNATQAAIRAGYSKKTAKEVGCQNLTKLNVAEAIAKSLESRSKRVEIDADYVLKRHAEIDQMDVLDILAENGDLKPISEWPKIWRQFISGFDISELWEGRGEDREQIGLLKKIKWPDKVKNLELLGKHVDVSAYRENLNVKSQVTKVPLIDKNMTEQEASEVFADFLREDVE